MLRPLLMSAAALATVAFAGNAYALDDQAFVRNVIQGDMTEIALGHLAEQKSQNPQVKSFGRMLVRDHTANLRQAKSLASRLTLKPPAEMDQEHKAEEAKYRSLQPSQFDAQFVEHMVADHQKDIRDFTNEEKSADKRVVAFARKSLPTLQKHLKTANRLQQHIHTASK